MSKTKHDYELEGHFKGVSIGTNTARLGFAIDRSEMTLEQADGVFSNSQLKATIVCDPNDHKDCEGQETFKDTGCKMDVIADVKGYRVSAKSFSSGLSLNKEEADIATLSTFANRKGKLLCTRVGDATSAAEEHDED